MIDLVVSSNKEISDISNKEITIPLAEYTDLIAKETALEQIRNAVLKDNGAYFDTNILRAILQI